VVGCFFGFFGSSSPPSMPFVVGTTPAPGMLDMRLKLMATESNQGMKIQPNRERYKRNAVPVCVLLELLSFSLKETEREVFVPPPFRRREG
jgi:hypothetical protein